MCIHEIGYGQFNDLDSGPTEHVDWNKAYVVVTCVITNIVDACITCGIKSSFNRS